MTTVLHQQLPTTWSERELLREKGQFWTPAWVAKAMVAFTMKNSDLIFDPAAGEGAFCLPLLNLNREFGRTVLFYGTDIDKEVVERGVANGVYNQPGVTVEIRDFILNPPKRLFRSIVANPPYIRHHRLTPELKRKLREISLRIVGDTIDGRAGIHIYFLIQALSMLERNGKLAFIMPADTCEGVFSQKLWRWISARFRIEAVVAFHPDATPFPRVDTNALVFLISGQSPLKELVWIYCKKSNTNDLFRFIHSDFREEGLASLEINIRSLAEAVETGLSRFPKSSRKSPYRLSSFARVIRGIATGANDFFFLTKMQVKGLGIPSEFLKTAVGRTRDVEDLYITKDSLRDLESKGRPTLLFTPDGRPLDHFPAAVRAYLLKGEKAGLNKRALIATRNPWYKMESRKPPRFLFAYLGRRNARFIRNDAGVIPLTGFLCVYPLSDDSEYIEKLWEVLRSPETISNLSSVGKSYGAGAIKVEPKALSKLPIPSHIVDKLSLVPLQRCEPDLFGDAWLSREF